MAYFRRQDAPGLMVVYRNDDRWDRSNVVIADGRVRVYDKTQKLPGMVYVDFGVSVFRREAFAGVPPRVAADLSAVHQA